jgi:hypothetical protein
MLARFFYQQAGRAAGEQRQGAAENGLLAADGAALHAAAQQVDEGAMRVAAAWPAAALIVWVAQSMLQLAL